MARMSCRLNPLKAFLLSALTLTLASPAFASYKVGGLLGIGGAGISADVLIQNSFTRTVNRSDSPFVGVGFLEYDTSSEWSIALSHTRGIKMSPFSSGVTFTGISWKWFYSNPAPTFIKGSGDKSTLLITQYSPWVGPEVGLANGVIHREGDVVEEVDASAIFFGFRAGVDYQYQANWVTRIELSSAMTPAGTTEQHGSLREFGITYGIHYIFE